MIIENFIIGCVLIGLVFTGSLIPIIWGAIKKCKCVKTVEYFPPKGASPMDVLLKYYGRRANARNIFNPLMLYWASRGFITIEEDCKRGLKLTKTNNIEPPESGEGYDKETYGLEEKLFCRIFKGNDVFYTLGASDKFAEFYDKVMTAFKNEAKNTVSRKTRTLVTVFTVLSMFVLIVESVIIGLTVEKNGGFIMGMIFPVVGLLFMRFVRIDLPKGSMRFMLYPFFALWSGAPSLAVISALPRSAAIVIGLALAVAVFELFFITPRIDIRTDEQLKIYAKICGFKRFLLSARADELEMMLEENPNYYFDILPYCYVLKITEKLRNKFDKIVMDGPGWYLGDLRDTLMF